MKTFTFRINDTYFNFPTENSPEFKYGIDEVISGHKTDITFEQPWYKKGYDTQPILDEEKFAALKQGLTNCVKRIINVELRIETNDFNLDNYHEYVTSDKNHHKVISKTRDLYLSDFNIQINKLFEQFEQFLGFELTNIDPKTKKPIYVIIRINRPKSSDFNPPHKDVYHFIDNSSYIPQFINIWIPICGVSEKSSLPVVNSSHLLPESKILRTVEGGVIGKNIYNVRMIKEWNNSNELTRAKVNYGEALFFSSHLIHGLAVNEEENITRVSLEFRLFKK